MFTILHTNDFHNHLDPIQADYLRQVRNAVGTRGLLLDAGDAIASGNITFKPGGEAILTTMSAIGYDAMTVGNREFHFSRTGFHCKVGLACFPVLCSNVRLARKMVSENMLASLIASSGTNGASNAASMNGNINSNLVSSYPDPPVSSYIVKTLSDGTRHFRVVALGLTVPMITERMTVRHASPYVFDDPLVTATRFVPQLRTAYQPDLLVVLSHLGIGQDRKLAEMVPGIDLIIGGHTHVALEHGERVGDTLLVQAGSHGRFWGRVEVLPAPDTSSRSQFSVSLLPLPKTRVEAEAQLQAVCASSVPYISPVFNSDAEKS